MLRRIGASVLGGIVRLWLYSLRLTVFADVSLPTDRPWVLVFFHGKLWPLLAWERRRATAVMVSHSKDGELLAGLLRGLGMEVVRGSSSRGGARALAAMTKRLRKGDVDAAFAVDGPRGPYGVVKPGAIAAARAAGAAIVPMGSAVRGGKVFGRAWDRFALAWPFGRAAVVVGPAVELEGASAEELAARVECGILRANARAESLLAAGRRGDAASSTPAEPTW